MNIKILIDFVEKFKDKDIDKKFNTLKEYKKVYMLKPKSSSDDMKWLYN